MPTPAVTSAPTRYATGRVVPDWGSTTGAPSKCAHAARLHRPGPGVDGGSRTREASGSIEGIQVRTSREGRVCVEPVADHAATEHAARSPTPTAAGARASRMAEDRDSTS